MKLMQRQIFVASELVPSGALNLQTKIPVSYVQDLIFTRQRLVGFTNQAVAQV